MSVSVSEVTLCEISEKQFSPLVQRYVLERDHNRKKGIVGCGTDSHLLFTWTKCIASGPCLCVCVCVCRGVFLQYSVFIL